MEAIFILLIIGLAYVFIFLPVYLLVKGSIDE